MSRANLSDKRRNLDVPTGYFAQKVQDRMLELTETTGVVWDTRKLSEETDLNYEYLRKIIRGDALPSKQVMHLLTMLLQLDPKEIETLYACDKIRNDYGTLPLEIAGKNPELDPIDRIWHYLSEEHKAKLISLAQDYARHDRMSVAG